MIVTCAECATQFQLDETRVPESGIRVRCSVCKHAFYVEHPDVLAEPSADPIARAVEEALHAEAGEVPEVTEDLEAADPAADPAARAAHLHEDAPDDDAREAESWEFSDGGRLSEAGNEDTDSGFEDSFEAARSAVDDLLGAPEPSGKGAPFPGSAPEAERAREPDQEVDPFDAGADVPLVDDPWAVPGWSEEGAGLEELDREAPEPDMLAEADPLGFEADGEGSRDAAPDPFADELSGLPAFGELATPGSGELEEPGGLELDEVDEASPPAVGALAAPVLPAAIASEPPSLGLGLDLEPKLRLPEWLARAGSALGWGVVATLATVTLWASVAPRTAPDAGAFPQPLAGLEASGIEGRWVENAVAGSLYVVRGELRNPGSEARAPGAPLAVRLLDAEGAPLAQAVVLLAPPLDAASLREAHPRELRGLREAGAREIARMPLAPGGSIAFEAVVESLPDAARRFDLVVAPPGASGLGAGS